MFYKQCRTLMSTIVQLFYAQLQFVIFAFPLLIVVVPLLLVVVPLLLAVVPSLLVVVPSLLVVASLPLVVVPILYSQFQYFQSINLLAFNIMHLFHIFHVQVMWQPMSILIFELVLFTVAPSWCRSVDNVCVFIGLMYVQYVIVQT